jgi:hypothetical protein
MISFNKQDQSFPQLSIINLSFAVFITTAWGIFNYLRIGLEDAWLQTAKLAILPLFFSLQEFNLKKSLTNLYGTISILFFIALIINFELIPSNIFLSFIGLLVIKRLAEVIFIVLKNYTLKIIFGSCAFSFLIGFWVTTFVIKSGYQDPLFELSILEGSSFRDAIFHLNLTSLYQTYGKITQGIMSDQPFNYHSGSHIACSKLSQYLNTDIIITVNSWIVLFLIPLLFRIQLGLIISMMSKSIMNSNQSINSTKILSSLGLCVCIFYTGFFGNEVNSELFMPYSNLQSFSYPASIAISLCAIYVIHFRITELPQNRHTYLLDIFAVGLIILSGVFKISNLLVVLPVYFVFTFFHPTYNKLWTISKAIISAIIVYYFFFSFMSHAEKFEIELFHFIKTYLWKEYFAGSILTYFIPFIAIFIITKRHSDKHLLVIVSLSLLALSILGMLPGIVFNIPGASAGYFWDIARIVALTTAVGLSFKFFNFNELRHKLIAKAAVVILLVNFIFTYSFDAISNTKEILFPKIDKFGFSPLGSAYKDLTTNLDNNENKEFKLTLLKLKQLPKEIKKNSRMHFERDSYLYRDTTFSLPWISSLYPQAVTGIAAFDLRPSFVENINYNNIGYGLTLYEKRKNISDFITLDEVLSKGKAMNLDFIFYFNNETKLKIIKL